MATTMTSSPSPIARYYINAASELLEEGLQLIESGEPLSRGKKPGDYTLPYYEKPTGKKAASPLHLKTSIYGVLHATDAVRGRILPMERLRFGGRAPVEGHTTETGERRYEFEPYHHLAKTFAVAPFVTDYNTTAMMEGATLVVSSDDPDIDWEEIDWVVGSYCALVNEQVYEGEGLLNTIWAGVRKAAEIQNKYVATIRSAKEADEAWDELAGEADHYIRLRANRIVEEVVVSADPERAAELGVGGLASLAAAVDELVASNLFGRSISKSDVAEAARESDEAAVRIVVNGVAVALGNVKGVLDEFGCTSERNGHALFEEIEHLGRTRMAHSETVAGRPHQPVWNGEVLGTSPGWRGREDRQSREEAMMRYADLNDIRTAAKQYAKGLYASIKAQQDLELSEMDVAKLKAKVAWLVVQASSGEAVSA